MRRQFRPPVRPTQAAARAPSIATATSPQLDDAAIMLELKAGNMAGFDFLMLKSTVEADHHFMYRMTHNQAVAEELAQEVFLRVYRSRETYRAEARFQHLALPASPPTLASTTPATPATSATASTIYLDEADSETGTTPDVADMTPRRRVPAAPPMSAWPPSAMHVMALPERQRMARPHAQV